jgi:hypothetical protein
MSTIDEASDRALTAVNALFATAEAAGGRYTSSAPAASIMTRSAGPLWLERLSMITMSPGRSSGTRTFSA